MSLARQCDRINAMPGMKCAVVIRGSGQAGHVYWCTMCTKTCVAVMFLAGWALVAAGESAGPAPDSTPPTGQMTARDSVAIGGEASEDAREMLSRLAWEPASFEVVWGPAAGHGDRLLHFPSPAPVGDAANDRVVLEWYRSRATGDGRTDSPAMVVLDVLDGGMIVSRGIAHAFAASGIDAFVMHMPGYGPRRRPEWKRSDRGAIERMHQAVCDARRARDVIAALPDAGNGPIGIQGTSLGGFVAVLTASVDTAFDPVFIVLAGGDLHGMLVQRFRLEPHVRERLMSAGFDEASLRRVTWQFEPTRIAHRLDAQRTWLFSAVDDQVVPAASARALATAARLTAGHHVIMSGNHVTCAVNLPWISVQMVQTILATGQAPGR